MIRYSRRLTRQRPYANDRLGLLESHPAGSSFRVVRVVRGSFCIATTKATLRVSNRGFVSGIDFPLVSFTLGL